MCRIRAFIGIDFDSKIKDEIVALQQRLRRYAKKGRWKHVDNFHLTLKFLGEISLEQQTQIDDAMKKLCIGRKPFQLTAKELGTFNGIDSIRALWLGLDGDIKELKSLQQKIDLAMTPIGFLPEKRSFMPHITLGQDIVFEGGFEHIRETYGEVPFSTGIVDRLFLFKSEQVQNKRIYTKVSEYRIS